MICIFNETRLSGAAVWRIDRVRGSRARGLGLQEIKDMKTHFQSAEWCFTCPRIDSRSEHAEYITDSPAAHINVLTIAISKNFKMQTCENYFKWDAG